MAMDMQKYVDDVRLRLPRYDVSQELDQGTIAMLVNRARIDVQLATLQTFPERYARETVVSGTPAAVTEYATTVPKPSGNVTNAVYSISLPADFIEEVSVFVKDDGTDFWETRKINKSELFQTMKNIWNCPTLNTPIHCTERAPGSAAVTLYVSKGDTVVAAGDIKLWYLARLPDLELFNGSGSADTEVRIGHDLTDLVVTIATLKAVETLQFTRAKQPIMNDIEIAVSLLEAQYSRGIDRKKLNLPSRESLYPNQPVPELPQGMQQ